MPKYDQLAEQFKERVLHGDYAIRGLPAERQLAQDSGVSYMTARRAVQYLIDEGFLTRGATGRIEVSRGNSTHSPSLNLAFLAPIVHNTAVRGTVISAAERAGAKVRPVFYRTWDDPVVADALAGFDGVFLMPSTEAKTPDFVRTVKGAKGPVILFEEDMSSWGIPCIRSTSPVFVSHLLDHLKAQGHRKIGCLNVQGHTRAMHTYKNVVEDRINQWQAWMDANNLEGWLVDEPVEPHHPATPQAYAVAQRMLASGELECDALLGITISAAIGTMRAMLDVGLQPGVDMAICTVDGEDLAAYLNPSLTAIEPSDISPYITKCVEWVASGGGEWKGPLLMQPSEPILELRDSTRLPNPRVRQLNSSSAKI